MGSISSEKGSSEKKKGSTHRYPYGKCDRPKCGEAIIFPGLDRYKCSKCGWIARKGQN